MQPINEPHRNEPVLLVPGAEIKATPLIFSKLIFFVMAMLIFLGLANLYSATMGSDIFYSQLRNLFLGLLLFFVFGWLVPPRHLNTYAYWIYGTVCVLLVMVDVMGRIAGGSQRWLRLGPLGGQPSELAKLAIIIVVARFFHITRLVDSYTLRDLAPLMIMVAVVFALIFAQPDFGTAGVCLLIGMMQVAFIRINVKSIGILAAVGVVGLTVGWFVVFHDYQKLRILNLLNPGMDPTGSGYNSLQSLVAVGSGQFWGKGFMQGTQTQLQFLPARHTDFIFSVYAEEHGFVGAFIVFMLFMSLCYLALEIARGARETFSSLLAVGVAVTMFISFMINSAMVLGLFPVVGVPLPFFSHGGTALLMFCSSLGMLVAVDRDNLGLFRRNRPLSRPSQLSDR